ncbi:MAG: GntR family transcriptional regulator [Pseudodonghicola sp.]
MSSNPILAAGQPRYFVVAQAIMNDIETGRFPVGSLLPTEAEFCKQFGVSRHTVREAIRRLSDLGLVAARAGVGTHVKASRPASHYVQSAEGISDLFQYVRDVTLTLSGSDEIIADEDLCEALGCTPGQKWFHMRGQRHVAGESAPIALSDIYVAAAYRAAVDQITEPTEPIYTLIERQFGLQLTEVRQEIAAVQVDAKSATLLGMEPGAPGLRVVRKYYSSRNELFEMAVNLHPGERFSHVSTLRLATDHGSAK